MKNNQKGFGVIEGFLILVIVGLLVFVGWYVWNSKNNADKNLNAASTLSNTQTVTKKTDTQNTQPKENKVTFKVGSYSLELKVPDTLKDLAVGSSRDSTFEGKDFTQATLITDKFKSCITHGGVLGSIYKVGGTYSTYPFGTPDETEGVYVKQHDSFYLMFQGPQSYHCGDLDVSSTHAQVKQAIIDNGWVKKTN
jgi:Tfp pilus assembly protein PilE